MQDLVIYCKQYGCNTPLDAIELLDDLPSILKKGKPLLPMFAHGVALIITLVINFYPTNKYCRTANLLIINQKSLINLLFIFVFHYPCAKTIVFLFAYNFFCQVYASFRRQIFIRHFQYTVSRLLFFVKDFGKKKQKVECQHLKSLTSNELVKMINFSI